MNAAPDTVASASPEAMHGRAGHGGSVNVIRIDLGSKVIAMLAVMTMALFACGVVMGLNLSRQRAIEDELIQAQTRIDIMNDWLQDHGINIPKQEKAHVKP